MPSAQDEAIIRRFGENCVANGSMTNPFVGKSFLGHWSFFRIPSGADQQTREEFNRFIREMGPQLNQELAEILRGKEIILSGVPAVMESPKFENSFRRPAIPAGPSYEILQPHLPMAVDVANNVANHPLGQNFLNYLHQRKKSFAAWEAPDLVVKWVDSYRQRLRSFFPNLYFTKSHDALVQSSGIYSISPQDARSITDNALTPFASNVIQETNYYTSVGLKTELLRGKRIVYTNGFSTFSRNQDEDYHPAGVALNFNVSSRFASELLSSQIKICEALGYSLDQCEQFQNLRIVIAELPEHNDGRPLTEQERELAQSQMATLEALLNLPNLISEQITEIDLANHLGRQATFSETLEETLSVLANSHLTEIGAYAKHVLREFRHNDHQGQLISQLEHLRGMSGIPSIPNIPLDLVGQPHLMTAAPAEASSTITRKYIPYPLNQDRYIATCEADLTREP